MYKIKCEECDSIFDHEDVRLRKENMGEHFGAPAYEEIACCPNCGADGLVEVQKCEKCGEYFESYELDGGICDNCRGLIQHNVVKMLETNLTGLELKVIREEWGLDEVI